MRASKARLAAKTTPEPSRTPRGTASPFLLVLAVLGLLTSDQLSAQSSNEDSGSTASPQPDGFLAEFLAFDNAYTQKIVALAKAIPEESYSWRPAEGVRSIAEVLRHVAQTNYGAAASVAALVGQTPAQSPDWTQVTSKEQIVAEVERSFGLTRAVATGMAGQDLAQSPGGGPQTLRSALSGFAVHHSEHLGQLIAYARAVGTTPPWSA